MEWQLVAVGLILAGAVCYLGRVAWRTLSAKRRGCGGCSCGGRTATPTPGGITFIASDHVALRRREAE